MSKRIVYGLIIALVLTQAYVLAENVGIGEAQDEEKGHILVETVDSITGEGINGVEVKVSWGSAFSEHVSTTSQGSAYLTIASWNYTGDVLVSAWDEGKRYNPKNKIVHVSFTPWVNTSTTVEIRLDRIISLESFYSGTYIKSLVKDRDVVYNGESAYIVLEIKSPYYNNYLRWEKPSGMLADIYGGIGSSLPLDDNVIVRIYNRDYSHFEKSGTFNISLQFDSGFGMITLEKAQFTLTFKPYWGYERYQLAVNIVDAQTNQRINRPLKIKAWWGSTFNEYESKGLYGEELVTFDLGAYPNCSVRLFVVDLDGDYPSEFKEVTVTESTTTTNIELQRTGDGEQAENPTFLYLLIALVLILGVGTVTTVFFFVKRQKSFRNRAKMQIRMEHLRTSNLLLLVNGYE